MFFIASNNNDVNLQTRTPFNNPRTNVFAPKINSVSILANTRVIYDLETYESIIEVFNYRTVWCSRKK